MEDETRNLAHPIVAPNGQDADNMDNNTTAIGSQASPVPSVESPRKVNFQSHGRAISMVTGSSGPARPNRLSVQFPIQPPSLSSPVTGSVLPPQETTTSPPDPMTDSSEALDGNFLHAIATSERKVLELKEELQRAQADLDKLKIQWARHEAQRKREDVKRITQLQPLQTSLPAGDREDDADGSSAWMQQEMERRKALMSASKSSSRTVFPGQRHTRTLSLLSPARETPPTVASMQPPRPPRRDSLKNTTRHSADGGMQQSRRPTLLTQRLTASVLKNEASASRRSADIIMPDKSIDQELLLRTGKELATNFKDGLWTFWEDLRQATVGEDSVTVPPRRKSSTQALGKPRKQNSKGSLRPSSRRSSVASKTSTERPNPSPARNQSSGALPDLADPGFWTSNQESKPAPTKKATVSKRAKSPSVRRSSVVSNEPWDTWDDSPVASRSGSSVTSESNTLPSTLADSPHTSTSKACDLHDVPKKDPIPWPVLRKTSGGLGTLHRTASNLMKEWETSLRPSPGEEYDGTDDFMGANAEAVAYGAKAKSP